MVISNSGNRMLSPEPPRLRSDFDGMTLSGATSFREVPGGTAGFNGSCGGDENTRLRKTYLPWRDFSVSWTAEKCPGISVFHFPTELVED